jgi:DNA polymerase-3 subunit epsilon
VAGTLKTVKKLVHREESAIDNYSVTELLAKMTDLDLYKFEKMLNIRPIDEAGEATEAPEGRSEGDTEGGSEVPEGGSEGSPKKHYDPAGTYIIKTPIWDKTLPTVIGKNDYSALFGIYIEACFTLFAHMKNGTAERYITTKINLVKNTFLIPRSFARSYNSFVATIGKAIIESDQGVTFTEIMKHKESFSAEIAIVEYIEAELATRNISHDDRIRLILESELKYINGMYAKSLLLKIAEQITIANNTERIAKVLFDYILYEYQISEEKKYYMEYTFTEELASLVPYVIATEEYIQTIDTEHFIFQQPLHAVNLAIYGIPDILAKKKIIELKFTNALEITHIFQTVLYAAIRFAPIVSRTLWDLTIVNLHEGYAYTIVINEKLSLFALQRFLCETLKLQMHYNVFLYDLETTGLDTDRCEIIECNIKEYFYDETVIDTLVTPVNPVPYDVVTLTGITNRELSIKGITVDALRSKIKSIFTICKNPIFIAHNGTMFDHKIMQRLEIFPAKYKFLLDSKVLIGQYYTKKNLYKSKETTLVKMYKEIVSKDIIGAHRAGADVEMINKIFQKLDITCKDLVCSL